MEDWCDFAIHEVLLPHLHVGTYICGAHMANDVTALTSAAVSGWLYDLNFDLSQSRWKVNMFFFKFHLKLSVVAVQ